MWHLLHVRGIKPRKSRTAVCAVHAASMRPRHKAAEFPTERGGDRALESNASMRPRHKAAEFSTSRRSSIFARIGIVASMRPRHKAAEFRSPEDGPWSHGSADASMRPRHKAAEFRDRLCDSRQGRISASMRPRHKAAEFHPASDRPSRNGRFRRFNEAAA